MRKKLEESMLKIALLSVSLLVASAPAINANIPAMAKAFPNVPLSTVELLTTISSMFLMISVLTSSFIARKIGYKQTILLGIIIVAIFGTLPAFTHSFWLIMISRALLGYGIGLFNSLLVTMISYFYHGEIKTSLFGMQSAFEGLGGIFITFVAGQLLKINWQAPFYAYLLAVPVILLFFIFVPNVQVEKKDEHINEDGNNTYKGVLGYTFVIFIVSMLYMIMGIKVSTLMTSKGYGQASDASLVIIALGIGSMVSGSMFGSILRKCKQYTITLGFILLSIAMFLIGVAQSTGIVIFSGFVIGFAFRNVFPYLIHKINEQKVRNASLATSLFLAGSNLGSFLSPYGAILLQKLIKTNDLSRLFYADGVCFCLLAIGTLFIVKKVK